MRALRSREVLTTAAMSLLALGACGKARREPPPAPAAAPAQASPAGPASPTLAPHAKPDTVFASRALPRVAPGDRRTYEVSGASAAEINGSPLTQFEVSGRLAVTAVEVGAERVLMAAQLSSPRLTTKLTPLQAEFRKLEGELGTPFLFEIGPGGAVAIFHFRDEPSGLVLGVRRWLAAVLQPPPPGPGEAWTTEESDATGRYQIQYRTTTTPRTFARRKLRYVSLDTRATAQPGASAPSLAPQVDRSEGTVKLDVSGVVDAVEIDEQVHTTSAQMLPIQSTTRIALRTVASEQAALAALRDGRALAKDARRFDPTRPPASPARATPAVDDAHIAGRTLADVLAGLRRYGGEQLPADGAGRKAVNKEEIDLYTALEALIRRRPGTVKELVASINKGDKADIAMIDALGSSGLVEAHRALVAMLKARKLDRVRLKVAAIALSRTQRPTRESIEGLRAALDVPGLRIQAMYGIGTSIRHLREAGDEAQAERLLAIIVDRLRRSRDPVETVTALRAIANSGHEKAFSAVEPWFASDNGGIRSSAMEALQLMKHPRVDAVLAEHIGGDTFIDARVGALRAAHLRPSSPALEQAAIRCAQTDKAPSVRLGAVRALEGWLPARPSLLPILQAIAEHETHEAVRAQARNAVASRAPATQPAVQPPKPMQTGTAAPPPVGG
jgi:hypothetical protein